MKFFVARVDLAEHAKTGRAWLAPLQFAFESPKFMLPVRLGMLNADGPQDMTVYVLTRQGRVETTNYRTVRMPTDVELPSFVREDFGRTYQAIFDEQVRREKAAVFTEYFWDMGWCDPCAANPLSAEELRGAGAFWVPPEGSRAARSRRWSRACTFATRATRCPRTSRSRRPRTARRGRCATSFARRGRATRTRAGREAVLRPGARAPGARGDDAGDADRRRPRRDPHAHEPRAARSAAKWWEALWPASK
jgi:hypothetical protein